MGEQFRRNPFMDYRNLVPFMDLSGFVVKQPLACENQQYCKLCEEYRNGRR